MIELVVAARCIACGICTNVCPTNVFDLDFGGAPIIARQADCQTCFMCELYCPADAIYVGPDHDKAVPVNEEEIVGSGLLGQYRRESGWDEWAALPQYASQFWRMPQIMNGGRELTEARNSPAAKVSDRP